MSADVAFDPGRGISHGIEAIKRIPIQLWLGGAILMFADGGGGGCSGGDPTQIMKLFGEDGGGSWDTGGGFDFDFSAGLEALQAGFAVDPMTLLAGAGGVGLVLGLVCCFLGLGLMLFALRSFILPGWYRLHEECLRTGGGEFSTLFSGQDLFLKMLLWGLLKGVILFAVTLVAVIPGGLLAVGGAVLESGPVAALGAVLAVGCWLAGALYVMPGLAFGGHAMTFDGLAVMDGLSRSWDLARGNRLRMILFFLVLGLVNLAAAVAGVCMLCVGVFVTSPLARGGTDLAVTEAYLLLTRGLEIEEDWALLRPVGAPAPGPAGGFPASP